VGVMMMGFMRDMVRLNQIPEEIFLPPRERPLTPYTDKPNELLESDSRMIAGRNPPIATESVSETHNPAISKDSPANK
jgi:hypothetical protein